MEYQYPSPMIFAPNFAHIVKIKTTTDKISIEKVRYSVTKYLKNILILCNKNVNASDVLLFI